MEEKKSQWQQLGVQLLSILGHQSFGTRSGQEGRCCCEIFSSSREESYNPPTGFLG